MGLTGDLGFFRATKKREWTKIFAAEMASSSKAFGDMIAQDRRRAIGSETPPKEAVGQPLGHFAELVPCLKSSHAVDLNRGCSWRW
jgi:hypothetical protein